MKAHYKATFGVILVAVTAWSMLTSMVLPAMPLMQRDFGTDQSTIAWMLTAYLLAASVATPIVGRIGDSFGKKRTLIAVLVVFAAGTVIAGLAQSVGVMIAARALQGMGGAILPLGFGMLRDVMPGERLRSSISLTSAMAGAGGGVGIAVAGPIAANFDYHVMFWIPLVFVLGAIAVAWRYMPESTQITRERIDVVPAVLLAGWLVALLLAVSQGRSWGWTSSATIGLAVTSVALLAGWVLSELRSKQPLVDMRMMRKPTVWRTNLVALMFGLCMYSLIGVLPQFFQADPASGYGFGASTTHAGLLLLPMASMMFVFGLFATPIANRIGPNQSLVLGAGMSSVSLLMVVLNDSNQLLMLGTNALFGAGLGLVFAAMSNLIISAVPASQTGVASGMNANIRTIGGSIGAAVTTTIIASSATTSNVPTHSGYTHGFLFMLAMAVVAVGAALLVPSEKDSEIADEAEEFVPSTAALVAVD